jgi:mono/diheme cytochrome c family protein
VDLPAVRRVVMEGTGKMGSYAEKLDPDQVDAVSRYVLGLASARRMIQGR